MAQPVRGIVTPEAVLLEFQTASVPTRVLQFSLDVLIQIAALFLIFLVLGVAASGPAIPSWLAIIFVTVALFGVILGYPIAMETLWNGRTVGMAAAGLRVVTKEGAPIRFRHAAVRGALGLVDFWLIPVGVIATVVVLVTRDNQRLGDLAAGTLVLRERAAKDLTGQAVTFYPPPGYEQYAASLDVGLLTPEQYGVLRSFLLRVVELNQAARVHLALQMANSVAVTMGHQPPAGVGPEAFLACVAAAYQWREGGTAYRPPPPNAYAPPPPPPPPPASVPAASGGPGPPPPPPPPADDGGFVPPR